MSLRNILLISPLIISGIAALLLLIFPGAGWAVWVGLFLTLVLLRWLFFHPERWAKPVAYAIAILTAAAVIFYLLTLTDPFEIALFVVAVAFLLLAAYNFFRHRK